MRKSALMFAAVLTAAGPAAGEEVAQIQLAGDVGYTLSVEKEELAVRVAIKQGNTEWLSVGVGNAGIDPEAIELVKFCADCDPAYFLPVYDASSTYGAVTGVLAWSNGSWWSLSILPMVRPYVEDQDGDGVHSLIDSLPNGTEVEFVFRDGLLSEAD